MNYFLAQTKRLQSQKWPQMFFLGFFYSLQPQPSLVITNTDAEVTPYHSYANELAKFCHDLYYRFQGLDGTKMTKISFRLHSLGCPGLVLCQIITVKSMDF